MRLRRANKVPAHLKNFYVVVLNHPEIPEPMVIGELIVRDELGNLRPPVTREEAFEAAEQNLALPDVTRWTGTLFEFTPALVGPVKLSDIATRYPTLALNEETGLYEEQAEVVDDEES